MKTLALTVRVLGGIIGYLFNFIIVNYNLNSLSHYKYVLFVGSMWFIPFLSTYPTRYSVLSRGDKYAKLIDFG